MKSPRIHLIGAVAFVALGLSSLPGLLQAQVSDSEILREEIRSALLSDPRTRALSAIELETVIEALAGEVEVTGQTDDFVPARVFYEELIPYPDPESRVFVSWQMMFGIIIVALGLALLGLRHMHALHQEEQQKSAAV